MNKKAYSEVYDIINYMSDENKNKIPIKFRNFIKYNRDIFYKTNIIEFPKDTKGLQRETLILMAIIYEKFISRKIDGNNYAIVNKNNDSKNNNKLLIVEDNIFTKLSLYIKRVIRKNKWIKRLMRY